MIEVENPETEVLLNDLCKVVEKHTPRPHVALAAATHLIASIARSMGRDLTNDDMADLTDRILKWVLHVRSR